MTCLVVASLIPEPWKSRTATSGHRHDGAHIVAFALAMVLSARRDATLARSVFLAAGFLALALTLEFLQTVEFGNRFEYHDVLYDAIGLVCGLSIIACITRRKRAS